MTTEPPPPLRASGPSSRPAHYPALDGLRALAVLLVLYNHAPYLLGRGGQEGGFWCGSPGAWLGVDLFFVLSGFLITTILLHGRGRPGAFRRFWIRRALRIFPLGYGYLLALALVGWQIPRFTHLLDGESFAWASCYLLNVHVTIHGWAAPAFGLLWSLAVEEHFYLLWPWCVLRASRRTVVGILLATIVLTPLLRLWLLPALGAVGVYVITFCRWDTLAFGALLALAWDSGWRERVRGAARWLALPALAGIAWVVGTPMSVTEYATPVWFHVLGYSGIAFAFTVVCALAIAPPRALQPVLANPVLGYVGRISYGLYVWHVLTAELTMRGLVRLRLESELPLRVALWLVVLFAVASASYRWFEAPLLRLKDRLAADPGPR